MEHDWTKDKAEWLVDTIREQGHYYFKLEPKQARAEAEAALRDARTEEHKATVARLREPDEELLAQTLALLRVQPEPDGGDSECVALVLVCLADVLDPSPPPTENENAERD